MPVVYAAAPGEQAVLSGGARVWLEWKPFHDGISQAKTPAGLAMDQLFVNDQRQHMARYPNYDPQGLAVQRLGGRCHCTRAGGTLGRSDRWLHSCHARRTLGRHALADTRQEARRLARLRGRLAKQPPDAPCTSSFGSWRTSSRNSMCRASGFTTRPAGRSISIPPAGVDLKTATVEVVRLRAFGRVQWLEREAGEIRHAAWADVPARGADVHGEHANRCCARIGRCIAAARCSSTVRRTRRSRIATSTNSAATPSSSTTTTAASRLRGCLLRESRCKRYRVRR